jgi:pimeloyl-ACP methyl ester carboxylesterase
MPQVNMLPDPSVRPQHLAEKTMNAPLHPALRSHTMVMLLIFALVGIIGPLHAVDLSFPGERIDTWCGFKRHNFTVDGCAAWIVEPKQALPGNPWSWTMEYADYFPQRLAAPQLLAKGFYHGHIDGGDNNFGCPAALKHFDAFYAALIGRGLATKVVLIGISRGGLYAYRWASEGAGRVAVIYGDNPVCDFKSWPAGKGKSRGASGSDWQSLMKLYGFATEAEALAYRGNPIDTLAPLAKAGVALIHVVGDADDGVPLFTLYSCEHGVIPASQSTVSPWSCDPGHSLRLHRRSFPRNSRYAISDPLLQYSSLH